MPTYFPEDGYVTVDWHPTSPALTISVWVKWESGTGPLVKTADGAWKFWFDSDGRCAYSLGDETRALTLPVDEVRGRWAFFALAVDGDDAVLWLDEGPVDRWPKALVRPQATDLVLMADAVGAASYFAVHGRRLTDDQLWNLWNVGSRDPEVGGG